MHFLFDFYVYNFFSFPPPKKKKTAKFYQNAIYRFNEGKCPHEITYQYCYWLLSHFENHNYWYYQVFFSNIQGIHTSLVYNMIFFQPTRV